MKKKIIILLMILISSSTFSQVKDTVYIYFDSENTNMKKESFRAFKSAKYPNEIIKPSYVYKIDEKIHKDIELTDSGYTFIHYNLGRFDLERGRTQPITIIKNTCYLKTIKQLDKKFFLETDYIKVCKTFEFKDSWEQDVIIFMIDKDEIKDGKIILREVTFSRPVKE